MMYNRLSMDSAPSSGSITAEGDLELVGDFDRWLAAH